MKNAPETNTFVAIPREKSFFPRFFFARPTKKEKFHFIKQVIYVFLGVKHIHVREKKGKKKEKNFVKSFGEKKRFFWEIFFLSLFKIQSERF